MARHEGIRRLALAAAVATFLLLGVGGIVTSRDAGMIFLDWPLSNGSLNPDGWLTNADKLSEHGHRILGAIVGLLTLVLAVALQRHDPRPAVRRLGWAAVVGVGAQGVLGGLRVTEVSTSLALVHGCTGQAFFCVMVALAVLTSGEGRREPESGPDTHSLFVVSLASLFALSMQVVLGARLRHVGGPIVSHFFGAFLTSGTILWLVAIALVSHGARPALRRPALLLAGLVLVQVTLGVMANATLIQGKSYELTAAKVLLPSLHQATGALMVAANVVIAIRAFRRRHAAFLAVPHHGGLAT